MAYDPNLYMPYGRQSFPQPNPQAIPQAGYGWPMGASTQYQQPMNGLVSVTGIEGARAYQLPPNSAMPLFDKDDDIMYLKTTDAAGYPTIKTFTFQSSEPIDVEPEERDYVPRKEFDALLEEVRNLAGKVARNAE